MKKCARRFTLVEMLTVIAIISILAGLVIPTVIIAQRRGRETEAKSDIAGIVAALKKLDADYGKILKKTGTNTYQIGGQSVTMKSSPVLDSNGNTSSKTSLADIGTGGDYNALIAELSAPGNKKLSSVSVNSRKRVYLDPKKGFDPSADYDSTSNLQALWRDPWGNPYRIYIKVTGDEFIALPDTRKSASDSDAKGIPSKIAVYSYGPNGDDDKGCNSDLDVCIKSSGNSPSEHKQHDDIASWDL